MTMTASSIFALNNHHIISPNSGYQGPTTTGGTGNTGDGKSKTVNGTVDDTLNGFGTFSKAMEEVNGQKTIDKTVMFANGKTKSTERVITVNADGSKTISRTGKNGNTSTIQESSTSNADGSRTVTRDITKANGATCEATSTVTKNVTGATEHAITRTNAQGQTETLDREITTSAGSRTVTTTGTGYNGNPVYNETTWNSLA
ncbi:MAG TPA: hypothetical protein VMF58_03295 [Rhizomicrobium sp.]|nr:hypothetical protein [Rhizomicrobium sp.]